MSVTPRYGVEYVMILSTSESIGALEGLDHDSLGTLKNLRLMAMSVHREEQLSIEIRRAVDRLQDQNEVKQA